MVLNMKSVANAGVAEMFDTVSFELLERLSHVSLIDDFVGAGHGAGVPAAGSPVAGYPWVKKIVDTSGTPTVAIVANAAGGVMQCALDATSEKQEATLYGNDQKLFDVTKKAVFEARVKLSVLPSASGVEAVFGLSSSWIDGPDNAAEYVEFGANGSGAINMRSQDGTTQNNLASGTTVLATDWHIYRIDASDVTNILFFIDGVQQNTNGQIGFAATGASAVLQPYVSVYKPSGAGVATLQADFVKVFSQRQ